MGHELLEHTADLGIRAWGPSLEAAVEDALLALAEVMGVRASGAGTGQLREIRAEGKDEGSRLVALLNETVFVLETERVRIDGVRVRRDDDGLLAELQVVRAPEAAQGIGVKAATYHQLAVEERADGSVEVRVFLDV